MAVKPSHDTLIHCEACGEDYSATYRRCPFCGARNDPRQKSGRDAPKSSSRYIPTPPPAQTQRSQEEELDDTYIFDGQDAFDDEPEEEYYAPHPKGGKRLAPKEGGNFELPPINWPRLITFLCSLVIIVAALVIVFTSIYPQLHKNKEDPSTGASAEISSLPSLPPVPGNSTDPNSAYSEDPIIPTDPVPPEAPSAPVTTTTPPTAPAGTPATVVNASSGLRVRSGPGTSNDIVASLLNGDRINVIAPAEDGWYQISFTGSNGTAIVGYIMGDYISTIAGTSAPSTTTTTPPATTTQAPSTSSGGPTVGRTGTIVNADSGLRVRSGPGTSNDIVASLLNGNTVTVVSDAGNGWYEITFSGTGGVAMRGYIMGDYISTN